MWPGQSWGMRMGIASIIFALALAALGAGLEVLGITDPETGRALLGLAVILAITSVLIAVWPGLIRLTSNAEWPFSRRISLHMAARLAYEETRNTLGVRLQARLNKGPGGMLGVLAETLLQDESIEVFGAYPPSQKIEQIPVEDVRTFGISDDATELFDYNNDAIRYRDLHIKHEDFKRRLSEIKAKDGA